MGGDVRHCSPFNSLASDHNWPDAVQREDIFVFFTQVLHLGITTLPPNGHCAILSSRRHGAYDCQPDRQWWRLVVMLAAAAPVRTNSYVAFEVPGNRSQAIPLEGTVVLETIMMQDLPWLDHSQDAHIPLLGQR